MPFWLKLVRDANLTVNNSTMLKYGMGLADRFATIDELLAANETDWNRIGVTNQVDRIRLINQARSLQEKVSNSPMLVRSGARRGV